MTSPGPNLWLWLESSPERALCRRLLAADPAWCGQIVEDASGVASLGRGDSAPGGKEYAGDVWPDIGLPAVGLPDIVLLDRPTYEMSGQWLSPTWRAAAPVLVLLLEDDDGDLATLITDPNIQDYLVKSQLQGPRLGVTLRNLWRQRQLHQQLAACRQRQDDMGDRGYLKGDRKQTEAALHLSQVRLRSTQQLAQIGWWDYDLVTGKLVWSSELLRQYGLDDAGPQPTFDRFASLVHPEDWPAVDQAMQALITAGTPYTINHRIVRPDGTVRHTLCHGQAMVNDQHQVVKLLGVSQDITGIRATELALEASDRNHRALLSALPDLIIRMTGDGVYLDFLAAKNIRILGDPQDLIGCTIYEQGLPLALADERMGYIRQALAAGELQIYRQELFNGEATVVEEVRVVPSGDDEVLIIVRDITEAARLEAERQRAVAHLRDSEQRYSTLAESSPVGIFRLDTQGQCIYVNSRWCEMTGSTPAMAWGTEWINRLQADDGDRLSTEWAQTLAPKATYRREIQQRHSDGALVWFDLQMVPEVDAQGNRLGCIGTLSDISARKQAELALQQLNAELEQRIQQRTADLARSEQDLRIIFNNVYDAIYIHDLGGLIIDVNDRALELSGATRTQLIGASIADISGPNAPLDSLPEKLQRVQAGAALRFEWEGRRFIDNTYFDADVSMRQVTLGNRTVLLVGVRNISDLKQAERALRETNADLENRVGARTAELVEAKNAAEAASQSKSIFLASMSHELRTPLNAILGFSQLIQRDTTLSSQHLEELKIINRSGEHLLALINDILEMSKIEAGQSTYLPTNFNLPQLLKGLLDMMQLKAVAKGLNVVLHSHPDLPQFIGTDSHKLRQVVLNLLSNAIKFTQAGYVALRVKPGHPAVLESLGDQFLGVDKRSLTSLRFEVEDSGIGIAPEELDRIFEPFVQTTSGRLAQEGTGLGLSISQQFVQRLGGTLSVSSRPEVGSTFSFEIPVQVVDAAAIAPAEVHRRAVAIAPNQPDYRILVVEDNWAHRVLLQNLLIDIGFKVQTAANGQDAVAHWQSWQPHLIFMDIQMPGMNGHEATQAIRHQERLPQASQPLCLPTKIISLTAAARPAHPAELINLGFDGAIRKPIEATAITQTLAQQLGVHYLYDADAAPSEALPTAAELYLTIETLQTLSTDWLDQFHRALIELDQDRMLTQIADIPLAQAPVAQALSRKVQAFEYEILLNLLQPILNRPRPRDLR
jgi:PAS domain S-box-containing protein